MYTHELQTRRVAWLMAVRAGFALLLLLLSLVLPSAGLRLSWSMPLFYTLVGLTGLLTLVYSLLLKQGRPSRPGLQIAIDWAIETALIAATGGIASPFIFLYIFTIVAAALFLFREGALWAASAATLALAILATIPFATTPESLSGGLGGVETGMMVILYAVSFFGVGIASGWLADRLRESESGLTDLRFLHRNIVQSIASGLMTTDIFGRITSLNRCAVSITGFTEETATGQIWWESFSCRSMEGRHDDLLQTGLPQRFEIEIEAKTGERRFLGMTLSMLHAPRGVQIGVIVIFQDLTEIRRMEEEVQRKTRMAVVGEMAAGMAHEIRNPLAALSGAIQLLSDDLSLSTENSRLMQIATQEMSRLNAIVTQFLQYARPAAVRRRRLDIVPLLSEIVHLLKQNPEQDERIGIVFDPTPEPLVLWADADALRQVAWNLCINALQAMPNGGALTLSAHRLPEGTLADRSADAAVALVFRDTGAGISPADLPNIFTPFFTTRSAGSGLGLSIVAQIIEGHDGKIDVQSGPAGTTFTLRLPVAAPDRKTAALGDTISPRQPALALSKRTAARSASHG